SCHSHAPIATSAYFPLICIAAAFQKEEGGVAISRRGWLEATSPLPGCCRLTSSFDDQVVGDGAHAIVVNPQNVRRTTRHGLPGVGRGDHKNPTGQNLDAGV